MNCLGYILTNSDAQEAGISYVYCNGNEEKLGECEFGNLTSHKCSFLGTALCLNGRLPFFIIMAILLLFSSSGAFFQ